MTDPAGGEARSVEEIAQRLDSGCASVGHDPGVEGVWACVPCIADALRSERKARDLAEGNLRAAEDEAADERENAINEATRYEAEHFARQQAERKIQELTGALRKIEAAVTNVGVCCAGCSFTPKIRGLARAALKEQE